MFKWQRRTAKVLWIIALFFIYAGSAWMNTVFQEIAAYALAGAIFIFSAAILLDAMVAHLQDSAKRRSERDK